MSNLAYSNPVFAGHYFAWPGMCVSVRGVILMSACTSCRLCLKYSTPVLSLRVSILFLLYILNTFTEYRNRIEARKDKTGIEYGE